MQARLTDGGAATVDEISRDVLVLNDAAITWHEGTITVNETWDAAHVHLLSGDVTIATGVQVTVSPGAIVKATQATRILVQDGATLDAPGTAGSPIIFTSLADDAAGGDTNLDGTAPSLVPATGTASRPRARGSSRPRQILISATSSKFTAGRWAPTRRGREMSSIA